MTFVSFYFLLFLAATAVIYFIVPVRTRWVVLLAASLLFYAKAGLTYLPFMLGTALLTYAGARAISGIHEKAAAAMASASSKEEKKTVRRQDKRASRRIMWVVVLLVIAYLFYTKFAKKILALVQTSAAGENPALMIIVPLGISYYTFSTVGYVLDVYWKRYPAEKNFFRYLLYVCYFPHILQGPIARYDKLGVQFREPHYFDYRRVCFGVQLILWGFFKKLVIADRFSPFITNVLADYQNASGMLLFFTMVMYAIHMLIFPDVWTWPGACLRSSALRLNRTLHSRILQSASKTSGEGGILRLAHGFVIICVCRFLSAGLSKSFHAVSGRNLVLLQGRMRQQSVR